VRRFAVVIFSLMIIASLVGLTACEQKKAAGDPLIGTWAMADNPSKTVKVSKEGNQYYYEGSQGKMAATKVADNTLSVPMSGIEVKVTYDQPSGELQVSFMGEVYKYKKTAK
jgi:hypothetical protein